MKKKGLGSSSDFSGSFGQLSSGCGLMKEKMCVCGMNTGGLLYFLMEVQQVKYLIWKGIDVFLATFNTTLPLYIWFWYLNSFSFFQGNSSFWNVFKCDLLLLVSYSRYWNFKCLVFLISWNVSKMFLAQNQITWPKNMAFFWIQSVVLTVSVMRFLTICCFFHWKLDTEIFAIQTKIKKADRNFNNTEKKN